MKLLIQRQNQSSDIQSEITDLAEVLSFIDGELDETSEEGVSVQEDEFEYRIELNLPEFKLEDFSISLDNEGVLTVNAETEEVSEQDRYGINRYVEESFNQSFQLPYDAFEDEIEAYYVDGKLTVIIPKAETAAED